MQQPGHGPVVLVAPIQAVSLAEEHVHYQAGIGQGRQVQGLRLGVLPLGILAGCVKDDQNHLCIV